MSLEEEEETRISQHVRTAISQPYATREEGPQLIPATLAPCSWASLSRTVEKKNVCCLSRPVSGLEQPELTETGVLVGTYCSPVFDHARRAAHYLPSASRIQLSLGTRKHLESDAQRPSLGLHLSGPPAPCTCSLSWPLTVGNTPQSPTGQRHFTHPWAQTVPQTGPGGPMGPAPCCLGDDRCPS